MGRVSEEELCQEDKELCPSAGELALTGLTLEVGGVGGDTQLEGGDCCEL